MYRLPDLGVLLPEGRPARGMLAGCACLGACLDADAGAARLLLLLWLAPLVEAAAFEARRAAFESSCLLAARPLQGKALCWYDASLLGT